MVLGDNIDGNLLACRGRKYASRRSILLSSPICFSVGLRHVESKGRIKGFGNRLYRGFFSDVFMKSTLSFRMSYGIV